ARLVDRPPEAPSPLRIRSQLPDRPLRDRRHSRRRSLASELLPQDVLRTAVDADLDARAPQELHRGTRGDGHDDARSRLHDNAWAFEPGLDATDARAGDVAFGKALAQRLDVFDAVQQRDDGSRPRLDAIECVVE